MNKNLVFLSVAAVIAATVPGLSTVATELDNEIVRKIQDETIISMSNRFENKIDNYEHGNENPFKKYTLYNGEGLELFATFLHVIIKARETPTKQMIRDNELINYFPDT